MIGRVLLAALLAGILAGAIAGVLNVIKGAPLIAVAETFENADVAPGDCKETMPGMKDCGASEWQPAPGFERSAFTVISTMLAGAGYAALLAGLSLVLAAPLDRRTGLLWGLCGFLAVQVATGA